MMPVPALVRRQWTRHQSRIDLVIRYLAGQGLLQVLNVLNGFFLLRWLDIDEQAKFSLAMALQATLGLLGDLGFGGSLMGLIGNRTDDKIAIGQYIRGIQFFKNRFLLVSVVLGTGLAFVYYQRHGWSHDFAFLFGLLLVSVYAQSESGYYAALLQLNRNLTDFYRPQLISATARLLISALLFAWVGLNALLVVGLTTLVFVANAWWMKRRAAAYYVPTPQAPPPVRRQIGKTLLPVVPMVLYYALQGQLTLFLAGLFGQSQNMAEVGALGRLAQLFALLTPFSSVVLMPYFARSTVGQLPRRYLTVCLGGGAVAFPFVAVAYLNPTPFLWLLGPRFGGLYDEIGLYVLSASVWYLTGIVWAVNMARRWNVWYTSGLYVALTLGTQLVCIAQFDLSQTDNLVRLNFCMACSTLIAYFITSAVGYLNQSAQ